MGGAGWSFHLERGLAVDTGAIREVASKPVEPDAVTAGPFDAIHYDPEVVLQKEHRAPVNASAWMPLAAVVLALTESPVSIVFEAQ